MANKLEEGPDIVDFGNLKVEISPEGLYSGAKKASDRLNTLQTDANAYEIEAGEAKAELEAVVLDTVQSEPLDVSNAEAYAAEAQARLDYAHELVAKAESRVGAIDSAASTHYQENRDAYVEEALDDAGQVGVEINHP